MPKIKKFHLIKDRYLHDDYDSGLYYDLVPVHRGSGDENAFNDRIDTTNKALKETNPPAQDWLCTLFLNTKQVASLMNKYQVQFGAKSYLLLYMAGFDGEVMPKNPWFELGSGGMVCNPTGAQDAWIYYTNWPAEMLGHCFRRVEKAEVDAYQMPIVTPPTGGGSGAGETPTSGGIVHLICPHCSRLII